MTTVRLVRRSSAALALILGFCGPALAATLVNQHVTAASPTGTAAVGAIAAPARLGSLGLKADLGEASLKGLTASPAALPSVSLTPGMIPAAAPVPALAAAAAPQALSTPQAPVSPKAQGRASRSEAKAGLEALAEQTSGLSDAKTGMSAGKSLAGKIFDAAPRSGGFHDDDDDDYPGVNSPSRPGAGRSGAEAETDPVKVLESRINAVGMPADIKAKALEELAKLQSLTPKNPEGQKIQTYLEWLTGVPWSKHSKDQTDMVKAKATLDSGHSGLASVKDRIIEFLAVRKRTGSKKGTIVCFTGPPGVGKTSIASAIADAMGRKFVRISLGGLHDETELRGHGRTYQGSMPGSIMRQMKAAGTNNPVMLLDEVDKIGRESNTGDPMAALLEVLDPAQNGTFRDHYLDVPYDLSQVLFVVTANYVDKIPPELRDRMEMIDFSGYTVGEKIDIAQKHIVPEKQAANGLTAQEASFSDGALRRIIEGYTLEAGVRTLRQKIDSVLRKIAAWAETKGEKVPGVIQEGDVERYLGPVRLSGNEVAKNDVGVATALAVNDLGGSVFNLEVLTYPGSGRLNLRRQMLEMIEDSAHNAIAYIKSMAQQLGISPKEFQEKDIDVAFTPAGKIDGPSAGITLATAIASRLSGRKVKDGIAMTGEITLTGRVLPIGGLVQKIMAAHRAGYRTVIFPAANLKDAAEVPAEVRAEMDLIPVKTVGEVFAHALEPAA